MQMVMLTASASLSTTSYDEVQFCSSVCVICSDCIWQIIYLISTCCIACICMCVYLQPYNATKFSITGIEDRVSQLQKQNSETYGKGGFFEEFDVSMVQARQHISRWAISFLYPH